MITLTLSVNQTITLALNPQSFDGKPGQIKAITWETISGNSTVTPANNGMTALITAASTPGLTVFQVGANTNMNLKKITKWIDIDLHQSETNNNATLIFNQISVNVVQTRVDSTQDRTTTNLGVSVGSPQN